MANCPQRPSRFMREIRLLPASPMPEVAEAKRCCRLDDISTRPSSPRIAAPTDRKMLGSRSKAEPAQARPVPMIA